jgi:antirestriction protein
MKIFITNLTEYNQGRLVGQWVELPCTEEELKDIMSRHRILDEEYFITETDGFPFDVGEFADVRELSRKVVEYEALESHEKLCVAFLLSEDYGWDYSLEHREDVILYYESTLEDVAYSLIENQCFGKVPESLCHYIDYEAIARDLGFDGYEEREEGVYYYAE